MFCIERIPNGGARRKCAFSGRGLFGCPSALAFTLPSRDLPANWACLARSPWLVQRFRRNVWGYLLRLSGIARSVAGLNGDKPAAVQVRHIPEPRPLIVMHEIAPIKILDGSALQLLVPSRIPP